MPEAALQRLAAASINPVPMDLDHHYAFERDGFIALVERRSDNTFGRIGTAGLLTASGLAPLIWRGSQAFFRTRASEEPATPEAIELLRGFQKDLERSISGDSDTSENDG
ncbi:MAG: hypothetical protein H7039_21215 [Bryobacteraceae bacterium]|nr:hypothetical protein [Bryobacteraceae bacterium]